MRMFEVSRRQRVRWSGRAILVGTLLWAGNGFAQDFRYSSRGDGRSEYRSRDYGRSSSDGDRGDFSRDRPASPATSGTQASPVTTPVFVRVTVQLPATYGEVDIDRDGQIGLYEWRKAQRPLAQFIQLDANNDGFLTPRELERAASMPAVASAAAPTTAPATPSGAATAAAPVASTSRPGAAPAPAQVPRLSEEDQTKADEAQAKSVFSILDKNRDGKVSAEEMAVSSRIRPLFEQAGVTFNEPMPADQFVSNYVRIQKSKRT